ncbi:transposase zinc-binding domain-containing protein [Desulfosporosinus nitroreducens]|uniref:Transposase zinc-binding domain-containing protein n=1 Tax=Desulfosporosinus nitroreducens TaxID=2018668 RepID=A0ABT8QW15_9FIRM|nr:transposase zinc-binding domain-containing protein [Desulfosporosinus nitroreducens]MDO0825537.1 transposase zinc-binding domain-containing protein [Desulfosporosinus nitroreducens]
MVRMPELQDIFKSVRLKSLSPTQAKAFNMIRVCRTSTLGSHAQVCTDCRSADGSVQQEIHEVQYSELNDYISFSY